MQSVESAKQASYGFELFHFDVLFRELLKFLQGYSIYSVNCYSCAVGCTLLKFIDREKREKRKEKKKAMSFNFEVQLEQS